MATVLEKYCKQRENMNAEIAQGNFTVEKLLVYQELLYRINVLETCMNFCKTAPVTPDLRALTDHYQLLDAFIQCMLLERRLGPAGDESVKKQRETGFANLENVVATFRKQFASFMATAPDSYRNTISSMVTTILPAWLAYRNTYVNV